MLLIKNAVDRQMLLPALAVISWRPKQ